MALKLALPLFGLEPEHFSSLSAKLLCDQNLRNLSDSGRDSPSAGSDSSGVSSLIGESTISESTPISSRPETPNEVSCKSQERREEKVNITRESVGAHNSKCDVKVKLLDSGTESKNL